MAALPLPPRLAHALLVASAHGLGQQAALLCALLGERDVLRRGPLPVSGGPGVDLRLRLAALQGDAPDGSPSLCGWELDRGAAARVRQAAAQLSNSLARSTTPGVPASALPPGEDAATAFVLAMAFPDRIGKQRPGSQAAGRKVLSGGNEAALAKDDSLAAEPWVVVPDMEWGVASGKVYRAAPFPEALLAHPLLATMLRDEPSVFWNPSAGAVQGRRRRSFGDILLSESPLPPPLPAEAALAALLDGIRGVLGLRVLPWTKALQQWRARAVFLALYAVPCLHLPDLSDQALLASLETWLAPFLGGVTTKAQLAAVDLGGALKALFTFGQLRVVETAAPTHFEAPSGSKIAIDYEAAVRNGGRAVVEVKLQEMFGFDGSTPEIAGVPLTLTLTAPNGRALQITDNLSTFWDGTAYTALVWVFVSVSPGIVPRTCGVRAIAETRPPRTRTVPQVREMRAEYPKWEVCAQI